jgi:hypothetical protein
MAKGDSVPILPWLAAGAMAAGEANQGGVLLFHDAPIVIEMMMHQKFFAEQLLRFGLAGPGAEEIDHQWTFFDPNKIDVQGW